MSIAVIVANGANDLEIPCLTYATVKEAEEFLTDLLGPANDLGWWGSELDEGEMNEIINRFFTSYYDGCGGVDFFSIEGVEHGKPFVGWDLD